MDGILNKNKIDYVFYHLNLIFDLNEEIKSRVKFLNEYNSEIFDSSSSIYFILSDKPLDFTKIFNIEEIPVLFPNSDSREFFSVKEKSIIFHHDILKSSFFLLSGYQEYIEKTKDSMDRYPFECSIQKKLDIVNKPVVNYYFQVICKAFKIFCENNNIRFTERKLFDNFGFILTHDIDRIDAYDFWQTGYRLKQALGIAPALYSKKTALKEFLKGCYNMTNIINPKNPFWNFEYMRKIESQNKVKSVFFFLEKDILHKDSRYKFDQKRIVKIISWLEQQNCEVGLHGTIKSSANLESLNKTLNNLQKVCSREVVGMRQHCLIYYLPQTAVLHEKSGLKYDSTLTFASHEGFRNSFCLPFKLFDFKEDRIINVWEFPLTIMDETLFYYRKLSFKEIYSITDNLINEIKKFHGLFVLLWHNTMFDENEFPEIYDFYEDYLEKITDCGSESITGFELVKRLSAVK